LLAKPGGFLKLGYFLKGNILVFPILFHKKVGVFQEEASHMAMFYACITKANILSQGEN